MILSYDKNSTLLCLFICYIDIQNVSLYNRLSVYSLQPVVEPAANCKQTLNETYRTRPDIALGVNNVIRCHLIVARLHDALTTHVRLGSRARVKPRSHHINWTELAKLFWTRVFQWECLYRTNCSSRTPV